MKRKATGHYTSSIAGGETVRAFVPAPLPPEPAVELDGARQASLARATAAVGRLDGASTLLPDPQRFLYAYVRREAVLSSQIEGTQSSLSDLLLYELDEMPGVPMDDVVEVSNYVAALEHGMARGAMARRQANFARHKTGSAARGPATRTLSRRRHRKSKPAWERLKPSSTVKPQSPAVRGRQAICRC